MAEFNWREFLGWNSEELEELRCTGYSYIRQGKYDIALPFFEALVLLDPLNIYDHQTLGAICLEIGDGSKALHILDKALKLDAKHIPTQLNRAKALFMLGFKKEGIAVAKKLRHDADPVVANSCEALLLAFGSHFGKKG